ncbi:NAD(P)-binding protein [Dichomitus squalens LYAD-421 SS1]|uniref:NAD(P)-binding protein n=1 Tax=Dichomitus squalens (strain LYAD-421) TaxID=732165 RepID=UPI0004412599|nr:NAD(P)-binding protein [Dichomitus squalens LYAD-421 SS1]EJF65016.1 NAD(P)-binding protein [Dichomitus squalens LYAD-421 SS1]
MSSLAEVQKTFLSAPKYAVVGASKDQTKFGTKVLKWYQAREKDVTPVHPTIRFSSDVQKEDELEGVKTVRSISDLPSPTETSISIITPPKITLGVLEQAKALNVPALWLQPGAEDEAVVNYIRENGLESKVIYGGPCILVQGDGILKSLL